MAHYEGEPVHRGPVCICGPSLPGFEEARDAADVDTSDWYERAAVTDDVLYFAVAVAETQGPIGEVILHDLEPGSGKACVHAHLFQAESRSSGHGEHALKAIIEYAFKHAKLKDLTLVVKEENFPARRCYAKCGFQQVDRDDDDRSQVIMCMTRDQWRRMVDEEEW